MGRGGGRNACALCILNAFTFVLTRLKYLSFLAMPCTMIGKKYIYISISRAANCVKAESLGHNWNARRPMQLFLYLFLWLAIGYLYIWPGSAVRWLIVNQSDTSSSALCSIITASCMFYNADDHMYGFDHSHLALHGLQREKTGTQLLYVIIGTLNY